MNIFRILGNALVFFLKSKQRQIIRKQKQIRKTESRERRYLHGTHHSHLAGPAGGPAHQALSCRLPPRASRRGRVPDARSYTPRPPPPSLPAWLRLDASGRCHATPRAVRLSLALPLLCSSRPNASVAAARHHRGHRHPGDALRCPRAPPSIPLPPRRAVQRRTAPSVSTPSSSTSRRRRSPSPPRLLRPLPEPTDQPCGTNVSSYAPRPSPQQRVRPLAPIPNRDRSISPLAMA